METNIIYNEDCIEGIKKIPDASVDAIITDPPYIVGANGCGLAGDRDYLHKITDNQLDCGFDLKLLSEYIRVLKNVNIITFCSKNQLGDYINWIKEKGYSWVLICWHKINPTPLTNNNYIPDTEYIIHIWQGRTLTGTYDTKKRFYVTNVYKNDFEHPTVKPLEIIRNLIINATNEGDIVLDPFLGTGTTALASKQLKRKYIGFEIKKEYFEIAEHRLCQTTLQGVLTQ